MGGWQHFEILFNLSGIYTLRSLKEHGLTENCVIIWIACARGLYFEKMPGGIAQKDTLALLRFMFIAPYGWVKNMGTGKIAEYNV